MNFLKLPFADRNALERQSGFRGEASHVRGEEQRSQAAQSPAATAAALAANSNPDAIRAIAILVAGRSLASMGSSMRNGGGIRFTEELSTSEIPNDQKNQKDR